jgi:hypothetical protein
MALMGIDIKMVDALGVKAGRATLYAVDCISLVEQELGQIGPVLACDACYQCHL